MIWTKISIFTLKKKNIIMKLLLHRNLCMVLMTMITSIQTMEHAFPIIHRASKENWGEFLGYKIASPIGISACAVTTSEGIWLAARLGCDILTYKKIRCYAGPSHPEPNLAYVDQFLPLTHDDIGKTIIAYNNESYLPNRFFE